ncbi:MAG TPA: NAD-glutamate dehydrogenase, partial [Candidatus Omnitrophota bacterium]|nr:NAD-glutamate dehydrogenase [Candidatus Omnitrophota bacterium]
MSQQVDFLQAGIADDVAALARDRLDPDRARAAAHLARLFAAGIPAAELEGADPHMIYGAVLGLLGFMRARPPAAAKLRVFDPDLEQHGWVSPRTVIEIVNDDMPFLVDSVAIELARRNVAIHRLIHPVLPVRRSADGVLTDLAPPDGPAESLMHLEIDRQPRDRHGELAEALHAVLGQVRLAVSHWPAMRERIKAVAAETAELDRGDAPEATAFLDWLHDDHFTFLGYRCFDFRDDGELQVAFDMADCLGILTDPDSRVFDPSLQLAAMPAEVRSFIRRPELLLVTKSARVSAIHRPAHMDVIGVKRVGPGGAVIGLHAFLGLFTAAAYTRNPAGIPLLRRKVEGVRERAGFPPFGHDDKALVNILETFPRDELFQISEDALLTTALGILRLQERPRPALFMRRDEFERFVSCLVFLPRDRYDTPLRLAVQRLLEQALGGEVDGYYTQVTDAPLARLHIIVRTIPGAIGKADVRELEQRIAEAARSWSDHLQDALIQAHGEADGLALAQRYGDAFPVAYRERHAVVAAVADVDRIEAVLAGDDIALTLYR